MIRRADSDDLASLTALEEACFEHPWSEEQLFGTLQGSPSLALIALRDSIPTAYLIFLLGPGEAELLRIATCPAHRRQGIARRLLLAGLEDLRSMKIERCHLEVRDDHLSARALYEELEFATTGRRDAYFRGGEDAILYTRRI